VDDSLVVVQGIFLEIDHFAIFLPDYVTQGGTFHATGQVNMLRRVEDSLVGLQSVK